MKISAIVVIIFLLIFSCKNNNRHNSEDNQVDFTYEQKNIKDTNQKKEIDVSLYNYIIDTFSIKETVFATVFIVEGSISRNDTIKTGAYLTILPSNDFDFSNGSNKCI